MYSLTFSGHASFKTVSSIGSKIWNIKEKSYLNNHSFLNPAHLSHLHLGMTVTLLSYDNTIVRFLRYRNSFQGSSLKVSIVHLKMTSFHIQHVKFICISDVTKFVSFVQEWVVTEVNGLWVGVRVPYLSTMMVFG